MTDKELDNYTKTVNPNFNSHIEKGTIEMSNEYYNLLEEKMARLINENQELKEKNEKEFADFIKFKREQYDEYLEKTNKLIKERQKLKKQLEDMTDNYCSASKLKHERAIKIVMMNNQQKEFIKYLEDEIKFYKNRDSYMVADILGSYDLNNIELELLEEILQKYKEIIGGKE